MREFSEKYYFFVNYTYPTGKTFKHRLICSSEHFQMIYHICIGGSKRMWVLRLKNHYFECCVSFPWSFASKEREERWRICFGRFCLSVKTEYTKLWAWDMVTFGHPFMGQNLNSLCSFTWIRRYVEILVQCTSFHPRQETRNMYEYLSILLRKWRHFFISICSREEIPLRPFSRDRTSPSILSIGVG